MLHSAPCTQDGTYGDYWLSDKKLVGWDLRVKKLRYVTVEAEHCCTTHYKYMTRPEGLRQMRKFDAFVDHTNDNKPPGVVDCFQTALPPENMGK